MRHTFADMARPLLSGILFIPWAFLHSFFADHRVKETVQTWVGTRMFRWYRLAYVMFSLLSFCGLIIMVRRFSGVLIWDARMPARGILLGIRSLSAAVFLLTVLRMDAKTFLGFLPTVGRDAPPPSLDRSGAYGIVRHPLYSLGLAILWTAPRQTVGGLAFSGAMSLYLWLGTYHEEQELRREFGTDYEDYSRDVPRLIPRFRRRRDR